MIMKYAAFDFTPFLLIAISYSNLRIIQCYLEGEQKLLQGLISDFTARETGLKVREIAKFTVNPQTETFWDQFFLKRRL